MLPYGSSARPACSAAAPASAARPPLTSIGGTPPHSRWVRLAGTRARAGQSSAGRRWAHTFHAGGLCPRELRAGQPRCAAVLQQRSHLALLQILQSGPEVGRTTDHLTMNGVGVTRPRTVGGVRRGRRVAIRIGPWASGLYFARLEAADGRMGFAPFVVRPRQLGASRVAVVLPPSRGRRTPPRRRRDGKPVSSGTATGTSHRAPRPPVPQPRRAVPLPPLRPAVPPLAGAQRTRVDVLTDEDLDELGRRRARRRVRPGRLPRPPRVRHHARIRRCRALPRPRRQPRVPLGQQLLLAGREARRRRHEDEQWRDLGRPERRCSASSIRGNDSGEARGSWIVRDVPPLDWLFAGTGIGPGSRFGEDWGIEIDRTSRLADGVSR